VATLDGPGADLAFRRGWTHGVVALAVLPVLLAGAMLFLDPAVRRASRSSLPSGVLPSQLLQLAFISILSHPILDTLNTYGVRWLMPLSGRWFYGDTLFIVDPWMWLVLGTGVALSRRRRGMRGHFAAGGRPARVALAVAVGYVLSMAASGAAARRIAARELESLTGAPVEALMVAPMAVTPLGRRFLSWARFPVFSVESVGPATLVHIVDLRYADGPGAGFGAVTIGLAHPPASAPSLRVPGSE
jgi:inner membrane protein